MATPAASAWKTSERSQQVDPHAAQSRIEERNKLSRHPMRPGSARPLTVRRLLHRRPLTWAQTAEARKRGATTYRRPGTRRDDGRHKRTKSPRSDVATTTLRVRPGDPEVDGRDGVRVGDTSRT